MAGAVKAVPAVVRSPGASLALNSVSDLQQLAEMLYKGGLTPPGIDSPNKVAAVILAGLEVGLAPTQALGSIMLTNGRLSIYGDGALALVRASGQLEAISETVEGDGSARIGNCILKRKGEPERIFKFSYGQAERAGLIERAKGKGPWASYPDRMLIMRARGFALRDVFPDVLRGLITHEEAQDGSIVETEVKVVNVAGAPVTPTPEPAPVAAATAAPVASAAPPAINPPSADGPVTDEQKEEFLKIRALVFATKNAQNDDERKQAWLEAIKPFGVTSVTQMNSALAARAIEELRKQHDPFSLPPT